MDRTKPRRATTYGETNPDGTFKWRRVDPVQITAEPPIFGAPARIGILEGGKKHGADLGVIMRRYGGQWLAGARMWSMPAEIGGPKGAELFRALDADGFDIADSLERMQSWLPATAPVLGIVPTPFTIPPDMVHMVVEKVAR